MLDALGQAMMAEPPCPGSGIGRSTLSSWRPIPQALPAADVHHRADRFDRRQFPEIAAQRVVAELIFRNPRSNPRLPTHHAIPSPGPGVLPRLTWAKSSILAVQMMAPTGTARPTPEYHLSSRTLSICLPAWMAMRSPTSAPGGAKIGSRWSCARQRSGWPRAGGG